MKTQEAQIRQPSVYSNWHQFVCFGAKDRVRKPGLWDAIGITWENTHAFHLAFAHRQEGSQPSSSGTLAVPGDRHLAWPYDME